MARVTIYDHEIRGKQLPKVCVQCGEPAAAYCREHFLGAPSWTILFPPLAIAILAISKNSWLVDLPVCNRHLDPWRNLDRVRSLLFRTIGFGFLAIMAVCYLATPKGSPSVWIPIIVVLTILWFLASVGLTLTYIAIWCVSVRMVWLSTNSISLKNLHPAFVEALDRERRQIDESVDPPHLPPDEHHPFEDTDRPTPPKFPPDDRIRG